MPRCWAPAGRLPENHTRSTLAALSAPAAPKAALPSKKVKAMPLSATPARSTPLVASTGTSSRTQRPGRGIAAMRLREAAPSTPQPMRLKPQ